MTVAEPLTVPVPVPVLSALNIIFDAEPLVFEIAELITTFPNALNDKLSAVVQLLIPPDPIIISPLVVVFREVFFVRVPKLIALL